MKIFIDSAKLSEIKYAFSTGIIDGVTTNPSLIKNAMDHLLEKNQEIDIKEYINKILKVANRMPVSLEITETNFDAMVEQGKKLFKIFNPIAKNVNIKIPINPSFPDETGKEFDGIRVIKELSDSGIPINATLIFTPEQALLAAKAGAKYVSPFAGRIDDYIRKKNNIKFEKQDYFPQIGITKQNKILDDNGIVSGINLVAEIVEIFKLHNIKTEIIAASIRNARQARESALVGAHIATIPIYAIKELLNHPKTCEGMKNFTKDTVPEYANLTK